MRIAAWALIRSFRPASCWSVEVMKGGCGRDVKGLWVTEVTTGEVVRRPEATEAASSSLR